MHYCWEGEIYEDDDDMPKELLAALGRAPASSGDALLIINSAETAKELAELPGVGIPSAEKMLENRKVDGEFSSFEDLKARVINLPRNFDWDGLLAYEAD